LSGQPSCFAQLDTVFPMGAQGLREVSSGCWDCGQRVECLKAAVAGGQGLTEELARREERAVGGVSGFLRRWNRLKTHSREEG